MFTLSRAVQCSSSRMPLFAWLALCCLGTMSPALASEASSVIPYTPALRLSTLAAQPDSDLLELSDGKRVPLGQLRMLERAAQGVREASMVAEMPPSLLVKPDPTGMQPVNAADLASMLDKPDSETVLLPSGLSATLGQVRLVQPWVEMRLGHALGASWPRLDGLALKVGNRTNWARMLQNSDTTVLLSRSGIGVTVGELKQAIKTSLQPSSPPPKPVPVVQSRKRKGR